MPFHELRQELQVAEGWRPHAEAVRRERLAVADDEEAELTFRRLDRVIRFAGRRFDETRYLSHERSLRHAVERLTDDAKGLAEFLETDEIAVVGVPRGPEGHVELELR